MTMYDTVSSCGSTSMIYTVKVLNDGKTEQIANDAYYLLA